MKSTQLTFAAVSAKRCVQIHQILTTTTTFALSIDSRSHHLTNRQHVLVRTFGTVCHRRYAPWPLILHFVERWRLTF